MDHVLCRYIIIVQGNYGSDNRQPCHITVVYYVHFFSGDLYKKNVKNTKIRLPAIKIKVIVTSNLKSIEKSRGPRRVCTLDNHAHNDTNTS